ncbi:site-specific recombinase XerD [Tenacibaculum skagerrakense]|uniref:Site-specific recombinase XerD n=1 Tax=Tenacibaculum skagerrakense TaxID=186571 RepID=A0A4R2P0X5_9FLAO|nr:site-specific integrase [Tenacibaculum skagerrakense]TCP28147.1 site-specific recombinase XerD [Tenacibaculum skagerrakense]
MQVSFSLRKDKKDKQGLMPVRMHITFGGENIRKVVKGVKSTQKHWRDREQRIKAPLKSESYNYHIEYNEIIDDYEKRVKNIFRYILLNKLEPTKEYIIEKFESGIEVSLTHEFFDCYNEFLEKDRNQKAERTLKGYTTVLNFLQEFENETGFKIRFETITLDFFEQLRDYAFENKKLSTNYFSKIITVIKTFMTWSFERDYHTNLEYKKFKSKEHEIEVIYLTMEELLKLYSHEFETKRLEHVRDVYCFGCFTGLRYSDIKLLKPSNVFDEYLKVTIVKTKQTDHKIPLNKYSKELLEKYRDTIYEPLPVISSQKFNKYLKECCELAEIDTPTTITRYIGNKRIDKTVPKYELITSHTARKTFVTNSLILGMKEMVVRNITGHRKEESFRRYVKIAEDFKKQEMDNTWGKFPG